MQDSKESPEDTIARLTKHIDTLTYVCMVLRYMAEGHDPKCAAGDHCEHNRLKAIGVSDKQAIDLDALLGLPDSGVSSGWVERMAI